MTMNKRGRGFDCERQNDKSLMQSCLDILQENYKSIQKYASSGTSLVLCVHGNKWGVATCCEDWEDADDVPMLSGHQEDEDASNCSLHCHQTRQEGVDKKARRKLILASCLCLVFMVAEIVGGVLSNSLAIATDAAHLLTDFASFMIPLFAIWMAARPKSQKMSFGWHRAEVLGATVSVLMIWLVTGILVYMAILRVINKDFMIEATAMLITSGLGVLVNIVMATAPLWSKVFPEKLTSTTKTSTSQQPLSM